MLQLDRLSFHAGKLSLLDDVSLEVLPGEIVVIAGSNGAGKSTLLKTASGTLKPSAGTIRVQGRELNGWKPAELARFMAVLPQHTALNLPFSVREVVMMGRYPHFDKRPRRIDEDIADNALRKTGMERFRDRSYLELSGGEQQRVQLARVFAQIWYADDYDVRYLFMDEPSNSLDIRHQHNMLLMAREFAAEGNCVLAILHDLNLALQYADKILLLKKGTAMAFGTPADILSEKVLSRVFDYPLHILHHAGYDHPIVMPADPVPVYEQ